jgi:hypothetical protein
MAAALAAAVVSDAFDRPDATALGNGWQEVQGDLLIQSQELRNAAGLAAASIAVQSAYAGASQSASARFASTGNNSIPVLGLVLRYSTQG